ncbi:MAG: GEVED domain-containing protein, partial [Bacteroidota bacterium]
RYRVLGDTTWTTVNTTSTTATLAGLTELTTYEFEVQSLCPDASTSGWSSTIQFTTPQFVLVYCNSSGNSSQEWIQSIAIGQSGNTSGNNGGYGTFTSTSINLYKGQNYPLTIQPAWSGTARSEGYSVWIDYNANGSFGDAGEQVFTQAATTTNPVNGSIALPTTAPTGAVRMRVSMKNNAVPTSCETGFAGEVEDYTLNLLDPIVDVDAPSAPTQLAASSITQNSLTLTWNASTDNVLVTGYRVFRNGSLLTSTTATTLPVTGLSPGTLYSFYVTANDAAGNNSAASNQVDATTLPFVPTYCASRGNSTSREFINRVQVGSINNTSGNNGGYGNFTALSTSMTRGTSQSITIVPGWTSTARSEAYRVWIDYNADGDFADAGEQVFNRNKTTATSITGSFTVPSTAVTGATRMRVSMKYNASPTSCEVFASGEVEDYTVQIIATPGAGSTVQSFEQDLWRFEVYPNPVRDELFISAQTLPERFTLDVVDVNGRILLKSESTDRVDVSALQRGVYLLRFTVGNEVITRRFIKE